MSSSSWLHQLALRWSPRRGARRRRCRRVLNWYARRVQPLLEVLEDRLLLSGDLLVTNTNDSGAGSLRYEVSIAQSGQTILFAPALVDQTINLVTPIKLGVDANGNPNGVTNLTIDGSTYAGGPVILISGQNQTRIFDMAAGSDTLSNLLLTAGNGTDGSTDEANSSGGAIYNQGNLTLSNVAVFENRAEYGGGISNTADGILTLNNGSQVGGNEAVGTNGVNGAFGGSHGTTGGPGQDGRQAIGGGIYNNGGILTITDSFIVGNTAQGGDGGGGGYGGLNKDGVGLSGETIPAFGGPGGSGGNGGQALGGGIYTNGGLVTITGTGGGYGIAFQQNRAIGGIGGAGGAGGTGYIGAEGGPGGLGGNGGQALGGGIYNNGGTVVISSALSSTFGMIDESATGGHGGDGGQGGSGWGGGNGYNAGLGGLAAGGVIYNTNNGSVLVQSYGGSLTGYAAGGAGGVGGYGGTAGYGGPPPNMYPPIPGPPGGAGLANLGGAAEGGAICNGTGSMTIISYPDPSLNIAPLLMAGGSFGGAGGFGGVGGTSLTPGGFPLSVSTSGATGGLAAGGTVSNNAGSISLSDITIDGEIQGGYGGYGGGNHFTEGGQGADGGNGGQALGGGIYSTGGAVTVDSSTFVDSDLGDLSYRAPYGANGGTGGGGGSGQVAGVGGNGGSASGGAIALVGGTLTLTNSTLTSSVAGGMGGTGGMGGGLGINGEGGTGGNALGGAIQVSNGAMYVTNCTLSENEALGGDGGQGGTNGGSPDSHAEGGFGGAGGNGYGGAMDVDGGVLSLKSSTLAGNLASGGAGGAGGKGYVLNPGANSSPIYAGTGAVGTAGNGQGGGLYVVGPVPIPPFGVLGGIVEFQNTIVAENIDSTGSPDVYGTVTSEGYNLIGDGDGSSGFGSTGDQVGTTANPIDPLLGPLQDNGGPTETMALLPGSPAIDAGNTNAAPGATDQRGYARIVGNAIDIGAYEYGSTPATTDLSINGNRSSTTTAGRTITYILTVTNNSSTAQSNVTVADILPANSTLVSWTPALGWSNNAPAVGSGSGTVSAWISSLAADTSVNFILVVQVDSGTAVDTVITDTASVGPITGDPTAKDNSITFNTSITGLVNVSSDVSVTRSGFRYDFSHQEFVQTITITNTSGSALVGPLALQLTGLSSNASLANASGSDANGNPYVDFVSPSGQLAAGQSITVTLYFKDPTFKAITYDTQVWQGY